MNAPPSSTAARSEEPWTGLQVALATLVALPAVSILWLILRYGVDTPFWDQWGAMSDLVIRSREGSVGLADLYAQYNESRKLFPRLVLLLLARLTGWNVRYEMALSLATAALTSFGLAMLVGRTTGWGRQRRLAVLLLVNLLLFGLVQHRNWLWGIQLIMFVPPACLVASLLAASSPRSAAWRVAVCVAACTVATYSFANGMVTWVLVLPALWLCGAGLRGRPVALFVALFVAAGGAAIGAYFVGYETPDGLASPLAGLSSPGRTLAFLLRWLGAPLGQAVWPAPGAGSTAVGAVLLLATVVCAGHVWRRRADRALVAAALPWLCLAAYPLASGLVTALGRAGETRPLASRYTTVSVYLPIALAVLVPLLWGHVRRGDLRRGDLRRGDVRRGVSRAALPVAGALLVLLHLGATVPTFWQMRTDRARRLQGKACLAWIAVAPEAECLRYTVSPRLDLLGHRAHALDRLGLLDPPLADGVAGRKGAPTPGRLEAVRRDGEDLVLSGWATLAGRGEPADVVLLCLDAGDGPHVIGLAWQRTRRGDDDPVRPAGLAAATGWVRRLRAPTASGTITAWAYDALTGLAHPLEGAHVHR